MSSCIENKQSNKPFVSAVIVSAGSSSRMGGVNKQFLDLNGLPVIARSISAFQENCLIDEIIIVTRECDIEKISCLVKQNSYTKVSQIIVGGSTRQESVLNGIYACSADCEFIAVHDGARPLVTQKAISDTVCNAFKYLASAAAVRVKDTVKTVDADGFITATPDRTFMRFVQTPQVFEKKLYMNAVNSVADSSGFTDDCMLIEAFGKKVFLTEGDYENIKITTPEDISFAKVFLDRRKNHD